MCCFLYPSKGKMLVGAAILMGLVSLFGIALGEKADCFFNPNGGKYFHSRRDCETISGHYWPTMMAVTEAQLKEAPYNRLMRCSACYDGEYIYGETAECDYTKSIPQIVNGDLGAWRITEEEATQSVKNRLAEMSIFSEKDFTHFDFNNYPIRFINKTGEEMIGRAVIGCIGERAYPFFFPSDGGQFVMLEETSFDRLLAVWEKEKGHYFLWPVEDKYWFCELYRHTNAFALPTKGDISKEEALDIARLAVAEKFNLPLEKIDDYIVDYNFFILTMDERGWAIVFREVGLNFIFQVTIRSSDGYVVSVLEPEKL
jgi:hypothetical protein